MMPQKLAGSRPSSAHAMLSATEFRRSPIGLTPVSLPLPLLADAVSNKVGLTGPVDIKLHNLIATFTV